MYHQHADGVVKKILVEDGQPVEFGQTLVLLNKYYNVQKSFNS